MAIMNRCYFGGRIFGKISLFTEKVPMVVFVVALINQNGYSNFIELIGYSNIALEIYEKYKEGDLIVAECRFTSSKRSDNTYSYKFIISKIELLSDPNGYENTKEICEDTEEETYPWGY